MLCLLYDPRNRYLTPAIYTNMEIVHNGTSYVCESAYYNKKLSKTSVLGKKYKLSVIVCNTELWLCVS